jgi:hypothetical protein
MPTGIRLISEAADLAARRHTGKARKGRGNEPYINHLAEVANLLAQVPKAGMPNWSPPAGCTTPSRIPKPLARNWRKSLVSASRHWWPR